MKKTILTVALFIAMITSNAQGSTTTVTAAELQFNSQGTIFITETDSISGELYFDRYSAQSVSITQGNEKPKKYTTKEVYGFRLNSQNKTFISAPSDGLGGGNLFYEDITPDNGKKLKLLKHFFHQGIVVTNGQVNGDWQLVIYSPSNKKNLSSNFKKIAESVSDCTQLADKINKKEKGYYVGMIAIPVVRDEAYERIVKEYNSCN